ncbi:MAG: hypothetical protein LQ350_005506 [Teloschistes chrysophthalmus]|nr:MAG: hypothetical protein LQ350_005506 [Niorma chrysophthalma]
MLSTDDAIDRSSSSPITSAQPRDNDQNERLSSSTEGLSEDDLISDQSASSSSQANEHISAVAASSTEQQSAQPSQRSNATSLSQKKYTRPNKYHGAASTWRDWTASERQLAASLDQLQAKDLSIHLYNAFWLKRRAVESNEQQVESERDASKSTRPNDKGWQPPEDWTAWPLNPDDVPRESENSKWEDESDREVKVACGIQTPSDSLQDLLVARVLKKAKERLCEREWEAPDHKIQAPPLDQWAENPARIAGLAGDPKHPRETEVLHMADDQRAKEIMQPLINHLLGKLDALLIGLHHARSAYATYNKTTESIHALTDEDVPRKYKRRRKVVRAGTSNTSDQDPETSRGRSADAPSSSEPKSSVRQRRYRKVRQRGISTHDKKGLGLRDWSDVLGVASMCGWDPAVVSRAAARCSDLFEEGMTFRTLLEGHNDHSEVTYLPDTVKLGKLQRQESAAEKSRSEDASRKAKTDRSGANRFNRSKLGEESDEEMHGGVHIDGFLQPIKRHQSWGLKKRPKRKR